MEMTQELQGKIMQFQQLQQQLQAVTTQRYQMETQLKDVERTIEELGKSKKDTVIYKSIGSLMIKVEDVPKLEEELKEHIETLTVRTKTLEKQENSLKERYETMQQQLSQSFNPAAGDSDA